MRKIYLYGLLTLAAGLVAATPTRAVEAVSNGGFETGLDGWATAQQPGSEGAFLWQSGTASPILGDPVPAPPGGAYAAMTDAEGPGSRVLYQDIVLPAVAGPATLSFMLYLNNQADDYHVADTLDFSTTALNQQFRVDIMTASAGLFSVATGDVIQAIYQTQTGDPLTSGYQQVLADISATAASHAGQTVRLRFAQTDNVFIFHTGIDDVSVDVVPEPGTWATGIGMMGLVAMQFRRRQTG